MHAQSWCYSTTYPSPYSLYKLVCAMVVLYVGRRSIFEVHLKVIKSDLDKNMLSKKLAAQTPGFAGMFLFEILSSGISGDNW